MADIRPLGRVDLPALRAFLVSIGLPDADARAVTIEWLLSNPTAPEGLGYLAAYEGQSVRGYFGQLPVRLYTSGKPFVGVYHQNVLVDPAFRGQGVATALLKAAEEQPLPQFGLWGNDRIVSIIEKAGFRPVRAVRAFKKVFRFERIRGVPSWLAPSLGPVNLLAHSPLLARGRGQPARIEPLGRFGPAHDDLFRRVAASCELIGDRGSAVLNWRYVDIPYRAYHRVHAVRNHEVIGWLVCRLKDMPGGGAAGVIVDFLVDPSKGAVMGAFLRAADQFFREASADFAVCRTTHLPSQWQLARHGYLPMPARATDGLRVKYTDRMPSPANRLRARRWFVTLGDSDGDL